MLISHRNAQVQFLAEELRYYRLKSYLFKAEPELYFYLAIYCADKSKYTFPHFIAQTKDERGEHIAVHMVGILKHASVSQIGLFTMMDNRCNGYNHIAKVSHGVVNYIYSCEYLLSTWFLHLDHGSRENTKIT